MNSDQLERVWDCIHIFAKTLIPTDPTYRDCFVCFFECLKDLIPDQRYQYYFSSFIESAPPQYYLVSADTAFEWTYKLRLSTILSERKRGNAVPIITLKQLQPKYEMITKDDWSQAVWFILHFLSANLPQKPNEETLLNVKAFTVCIRYLLPCPKCKAHMEVYLSEHSIDKAFGSGWDIFEWTCDYHEAVNSFDTARKHDKIDRKQVYSIFRVISDAPKPTNYEFIDSEF